MVEPSSNNGRYERDIARLVAEAEGELACIQAIAKGEGVVLLNVTLPVSLPSAELRPQQATRLCYHPDSNNALHAPLRLQ
jgi:hypothetical protein